MDNIVVIGGNGQLGCDLIRAGRARNWNLTALEHSQIEISDLNSVEKVLGGLKPTVVINTAACHGANQYTAADQEEFFRVNSLGALNLARVCRQLNVTLVHYSTDYVFGQELNRNQPCSEQDPPAPVNVYGASKLAGESLVRALCPRHYVVRLASLYGSAGCRAKGKSNFVKLTLGKVRRGEDMKVVNDQFMSPTWAGAVARKTFELVCSGAKFGLYHMAGSGSCSWYEFACAIVGISKGKIQIQPITTPEEGPDEIFLRPRWTVLENSNLRKAGLADLPHWRESLEQYIRNEERP